MKVLIITEEQYPYNLGGGTSYLTEYEKGLKYHKVDYTVLATKYLKATPSKKEKSVYNLGIHHREYNSFLLRSIFKVYYYFFWYCAIIIALVRNKELRQCDIIHAHEMIFSGIFALLLGKVTSKKVVLTAHGRYVDGIKDRISLPKFVFSLLYTIERHVVKRADRVICISRDIQKYYSKYNPNTLFIPNFIDTSQFTRSKTQKATVHTIGYIGRLSKEKNVDIILQAAELMPKKKFVIVGDGPERAALESYAQENNLKNVEFLGRRSDIAKIHHSLDLVVYLWIHEPFGLSAIEAMASGVPVIAIDTNELHYFVGQVKAGVLIPASNLSGTALKNAIAKFDDRKFYITTANNAFKISREYDYKKIIKRYIDEYNKILEN